MSSLQRSIHVVDDDEAVRRSLAALLVSRGYGVQPHASGEAFLAAADLTRQGCVLLDLRMDGLSGLQVFEALRACGSPLRVLFLSGHGDIPSVRQALKDGAVDWLEKPCADDELIARIDDVLARATADAAAERERAAVLQRWRSLTERELEVALLVAQGLSNKKVARSLLPPCDVRTVETHRSRALAKCQVTNAVELANFVREHRLDLVQ
jgi:two-component system response regulator TtrR